LGVSGAAVPVVRSSGITMKVYAWERHDSGSRRRGEYGLTVASVWHVPERGWSGVICGGQKWIGCESESVAQDLCDAELTKRGVDFLEGTGR